MKKSSSDEAIAQLTANRGRVDKLVKRYDKLAKAQADATERRALAADICAELTAHATDVDEIFCPAARATLKEQVLIDEVGIEHASAEELTRLGQVGPNACANP